jgi:hypothetical protein
MTSGTHSKPHARWSTSRIRKPAWLVAATAGVAVAATSAFATILSTVPAVVMFVPLNVQLNITQSNIRIIAFDERQCVKFPNGLTVDGAVLPPGTVASCHLLHLDPVSGGPVLSGIAQFNAPILGVISSSALLDASDFCGRPGVTYPLPGVEPFRGLEAFQPTDQYTVTGNDIKVQMDVPSYSDQVRVLTRCL